MEEMTLRIPDHNKTVTIDMYNVLCAIRNLEKALVASEASQTYTMTKEVGFIIAIMDDYCTEALKALGADPEEICL